MGYGNLIPHCCEVYFNGKEYRTTILQLDHRRLLESYESNDDFKEQFLRRLDNGKDWYMEWGDYWDFEKGGNGDDFVGDYHFGWSCKPIKNENYDKIVKEFGNRDEWEMEDTPIYRWFGVGSGKVFVEEGRWNLDEEGKQIYDKKLDDWISNPNYRFEELEKNEELFKVVYIN